MIQVGITHILDGKVVDNECIHDKAPFVVPEPGGSGCLVLVEFGKAVSEEFVGKDACLGDRICHGASQSRSRSHGQSCLVVLFNKFLEDVFKFDADVLWPVERGVQIEVLEVHCGPSLALRWERTLSTSNLTSSVEPGGVPTPLEYAMLFPPMVMCVRLTSSPFSGWTLQTTLE
jgi:hypothetical protein